jgi:hypothetical protein
MFTNTGSEGYIGWRNRFLGSLNVYKFGLCFDSKVRFGPVRNLGILSLFVYIGTKAYSCPGILLIIFYILAASNINPSQSHPHPLPPHPPVHLCICM